MTKELKLTSLTWQESFPSTPPAQIMPSLIAVKSAKAVVQVSLLTTGTSTSSKTSEEAPSKEEAVELTPSEPAEEDSSKVTESPKPPDSEPVEKVES